MCLQHMQKIATLSPNRGGSKSRSCKLSGLCWLMELLRIAAHIGHALENWMKIASGLPEDKNSPGPRSTAVFAAIGRLFRQPDAIRVPPFAFVLLGKNFFEPMGLMLSDCLIHN